MTVWRDERIVEEVRQQWRTMSASKLSTWIFVKYGVFVSRNAIIGKANRLGLSKNANSGSAAGIYGVAGMIRPERLKSRSLANPVKYLSSDGCRYLIGEMENPDCHFCEAETIPGQSWCKDHAKIVFQAA